MFCIAEEQEVSTWWFVTHLYRCNYEYQACELADYILIASRRPVIAWLCITVSIVGLPMDGRRSSAVDGHGPWRNGEHSWAGYLS